MNIDKMILGYNLSQKKKVTIGNYMIKFHRRKVSKRKYDYLYVIEIFFKDNLIRRGIFSEYSNAVDFAGEFLYYLL